MEKENKYRWLPENDTKRQWFAIIVTDIIAALLTLWGIYGIGEYGMALFLFTPFLIGFLPAVLYGLKKQITCKEAFRIGFIAFLILLGLLIVFAIEGIICIAMVTPVAVLFVWIGSILGFSLVDKMPNNAIMSILIVVCVIPTMSFWEKKEQPSLSSVSTAIEINASPETVWQNVIQFPQLNPPTEFLFKTGIAYPINAQIEGKGIGAIRHCNFTTGSFVEPITVWIQPNLLKFSVDEQPAPMKEISFWNVDAPHLHDYFVSKEGQFKLTKLPNGHTLLEGTTWYYHNIRPEIYWRLWSNYIVHKIHFRVLNHIKNISEKQSVKI